MSKQSRWWSAQSVTLPMRRLLLVHGVRHANERVSCNIILCTGWLAWRTTWWTSTHYSLRGTRQSWQCWRSRRQRAKKRRRGKLFNLRPLHNFFPHKSLIRIVTSTKNILLRILCISLQRVTRHWRRWRALGYDDWWCAEIQRWNFQPGRRLCMSTYLQFLQRRWNGMCFPQSQVVRQRQLPSTCGCQELASTLLLWWLNCANWGNLGNG